MATTAAAASQRPPPLPPPLDGQCRNGHGTYNEDNEQQ
jgi:hypothetical protein